jgi:hypothetical protein
VETNLNGLAAGNQLKPMWFGETLSRVKLWESLSKTKNLIKTKWREI